MIPQLGARMLTLATKFLPERLAFETAKRAGFRAAEFWLDANLLLKNDTIATVAYDYLFRYAIHFPNQGPLSNEALEGAVNLYRRLNCTAMIIHQPMFDLYGEALRQMAPEVDLAIENHLLDLTGIDRWADESPGLTLDVEHLWLYTLRDAPLAMLLDNIEHLLMRFASKIHHVHLPGYSPGGEEHHPISESPEMANEVLTRLHDHGYGKLVVSEAEEKYQSDEFLRNDVLFFERWTSSLAAKSAKRNSPG